MVIDDDKNVYGFSHNGTGRYRSILGNLTQLHEELGCQQLHEFYFTDSDDENSPEDTFRLSDYEPNPAIVPYAMGVNSPVLENYSLDSRFERFTLIPADENTLPLLDIMDVAGDWESRTVFCNDISCNVYRISITLESDGAMHGGWSLGDVLTPDTHDLAPIHGTVASQGQYLASNFEEELITTSLHKNGVLYQMDDKLLFNAFGMQIDGAPDAIVTLLTRLP